MKIDLELLSKLIVNYRNSGSSDKYCEPLNGDEIEDFIKKLRIEIRKHEGDTDIVEEKYYDSIEYAQYIQCPNCGNTEEMSADMPRHKFEEFELLEYIDGGCGKYRCLNCNSKCFSQIEKKEVVE